MGNAVPAIMKKRALCLGSTSAIGLTEGHYLDPENPGLTEGHYLDLVTHGLPS